MDNDNQANKPLFDLLEGPFLSPMVRAAFPGMREVCRRNGASITFSEAVVASNITQADLYESDIDYYFIKPNSRVMQISKAEVKNTFVQLVGNDPQTLYQATILLEGLCLGVDLNAGCTKDWVGCQYGSNLLSDIDLLINCLKEMRKAANKINILCSVKIRLLNTVEETSLLVTKLFNEVGLDLVTIHARHVFEERGSHQANLADFVMIYNTVKSQMKPSQKLAYNGDIWGKNDFYKVQSMCNQCTIEELFSKKDINLIPVMIARGAIRDPSIFKQIKKSMELIKNHDINGYKQQLLNENEVSTLQNIKQLIDSSKLLHHLTEQDYKCYKPSSQGRCTEKIHLKDYKFQQLRCCIQFLLKQQQQMQRDISKKQLDKYIAEISHIRTVQELESIFEE